MTPSDAAPGDEALTNQGQDGPPDSGWKAIASAIITKGLPIGALGGLATAIVTVHNYYTTRSIPVNISVRLESDVLSSENNAGDLKSAATDQTAAGPILPVQFSLEAENVSDFRTLLVHNPIWVAYGWKMYGSKLFYSEEDIEKKKIESADQRIRRQIEREFGDLDSYKSVIKSDTSLPSQERDKELDLSNQEIQRDATKRRFTDHVYTRSIIGAGTLFGNNDLNPNEKVTATHIIPVLKDAYDIVEVRLIIPTTNEYRRRFFYSERITHDDIRANITLYEFDDKRKKTNPRVAFCKPSKESGKCDILSKSEERAVGANIQNSFSQLWVRSKAKAAS